MPDFPQSGIVFEDSAPVLANAKAFATASPRWPHRGGRSAVDELPQLAVVGASVLIELLTLGGPARWQGGGPLHAALVA